MRATKRSRFVALWGTLGMLCVAALAKAEPAPGYQWQSKLDGKTVCAQASPGAGWRQGNGPYKDPHCQQAIHRS